jgi:hypothetical protein
MNNTVITRIAVVGSKNEIVGYSGTSRVEGWESHAKAKKADITNFINWCNDIMADEENEGPFTLERFGSEFDAWQEEMDELHGFEEDEEDEEDEGEGEGDEESEEDDEERSGMVFSEEYKAKYAQHGQSCGDDVAGILKEEVTIQVPRINKEGKKTGTKDSCSMSEMKNIAKANELGSRLEGWLDLNIGHIRMVLGNALRARINRGEKVVIGKKTWKEDKKLQEEAKKKKEKLGKKFEEMKKKNQAKAGANKTAKKDNKVKKGKKAKK